MNRLGLGLALAILLQGCGSLPRPFLHEGADQALVSPKRLAPISVTAPADMPDLSKAVVVAFDKEEDIAATEEIGGDKFLRMIGGIDGDGPAKSVHWRLLRSDGQIIGDVTEPLPPSPITPEQMRQIARKSVASVAHMLRGDDLGTADLAARPRVAVDQVKVNNSLDAELLKRSLITALEQHGIAVVSENAQMRVRGGVKITQGLAGHDLVEVSWIVDSDKGVELFRVEQGQGVRREEILSHANQMTHDIAGGGAEGIADGILRVARSKAKG